MSIENRSKTGDAPWPRLPVLILLISALAILVFSFQGSRGIWEPDEGFYVSTAWSMLDDGDLIIPRLQGEPFLDKPPLTYWGIAAGMKLLGRNEGGARIFHALCFMLTVLLVGVLGKSLYGGRATGVAAGLIYATMALPFAASNIVTPDTPLALWTTAAFFCFWKSARPGARQVTLWKMLMCLAFGLGFLTKGPAALIPSSGMFVYLLLRRRARQYFLTPWALLGFSVFCLVGMSWYLVLSTSLPGALEYFWDNQVWGRTISGKYQRNPGLFRAVVIYLPTLLFGSLPWSLMGLPKLRRAGRSLLRRETWAELRNRPVALFLLTWFLAPLLVLSLASSKLPLYVLPLFSSLALATAPLLAETRALNAVKAGRWMPSSRLMKALGVWVLMLLIGKKAIAYYPSSRDSRALWAAVYRHLPRDPHELVVVDNRISGLSFYGVEDVERVTTRQHPYPFFSMPETLREEIDEIPWSPHRHVFLCSRESKAAQVRQGLGEVGVTFSEIPLPHQWKLVICEFAGRPAAPSGGAVAIKLTNDERSRPSPRCLNRLKPGPLQRPRRTNAPSSRRRRIPCSSTIPSDQA